ncbi:hypothetical protein C0991_010043, partial [Blastosporella zonata]
AWQIRRSANYKITDEGCRLAHWDHPHGAHDSPNPSSSHLPTERSSVEYSIEGGEKKIHDDAKFHCRTSVVQLNSSHNAANEFKESNTTRIRCILEQPALRSLF